jgi:hypothetical protein
MVYCLVIVTVNNVFSLLQFATVELVVDFVNIGLNCTSFVRMPNNDEKLHRLFVG